MDSANSSVEVNNAETQSLPEKDKIFCSRRFYLNCEFINGVLFICAITLIAVGTYNLLVIKMSAKECSHTGSNHRTNTSIPPAATYPMIVVGCVLLAFCTVLLVVMLLLARETVKYMRRFSNQLPTYDEAVHTKSASETSMDDVWSV